MKRTHLSIIALGLCLGLLALHAQDGGALQGELDITADQVSYAVGSAEASADGNVVLVYQDVRLTCQHVRVNRETGDYSAQGGVEVTYAQRGTWRSEAIQGNLNEKRISFGPFKLDGEVWHGGGDGGEGEALDSGEIRHAWLTTCDCEKPHYTVNATRFRFHPKDKTFTATNATLRLFGIPVFYLPWLAGSTDNSAGLIIHPGYGGKRGAFLRLGRVWKHGDNGDSRLYLDSMSKRGFGLGENTTYRSETREIATDLYAIHDWKPTETEHGWDRRFKRQEDRFRTHLYAREELTQNMTLRLNVDWLSDISMLEDWFKREWRHIGQPKSVASLDYDLGWLDAAIEARPRINSFYTVGERLPELRLNVPRASLFGSLLHYDSATSAGYYTMKWRRSDRPRLLDPALYNGDLYGDPNDYSAFRADTLHTFSLPINVQEFVTLTPRASFRATSYSKSSRRRISTEDLANLVDADNPDAPYNTAPVRNYDDRGGARLRLATEFGLEARSRLSADFGGLREGDSCPVFRHVVEPYLNYTYAPSPTQNRDHLYFFDETDRLQRQHFVRLGLDQRWGEVKDGALHPVLSLESYLDAKIRRDIETDSHWGDLGNRLTLQTSDDFKTWGALLYDIGEGDIHRGEVGLQVGADEALHFSGKYIYRKKHLSASTYSMGSSLLDLTGESAYVKKHFESADTISGTLFVPLTEDMSVEIYHEYDFERHCVAEHSYELTKRLHCWTVVAGVGWDYGDFRATVMLRLTAFPQVKIDMNI